MNYTGREVDEIQARRDAYAREGMLVALCLAALSGAFVMGIAWWLLS